MAGHPESVINPCRSHWVKFQLYFEFHIHWVFYLKYEQSNFLTNFRRNFLIYNLPNFSFSKTKQSRDLIIFFVISGIISVHE